MATPTTLPASFSSGAVLTAAQMNNLRGAFRVLQVVSTTKTDTFASASTAANTTVDITGLTATITPSSTSSKILCMFSVYGQIEVGGQRQIFTAQLFRGSTAIGVGDAAGSRTRVTGQNGNIGIYDGYGLVSAVHLDSPNTTSATTYKVSGVTMSYGTSAMTLYVNRIWNDIDSAVVPRTASFLTVMEISA